jgi:hypothetical protein
MSIHKHATVSSWQRDHDGTYAAELNGYKLKVVWVPEGGSEPKGFRWEGEGPDGKRIGNKETQEEIEHAMAEAEAAAEQDAPADEEAA